ncbi:uncharacterized protein At4g26450 [Ricinus communis]|uniref:Uncharacterized protein n=1 Tax=Ricinus communis TaxID=3988 RepID=B9SHY5_RICCO|nr:uncharacterized protein At4g26450 [Ricinus communis]XP_015578785.1 uncharacterized protein At4g26450 [Ricinus communis]EEF36722.1 conserved hypothetical protein [Ricinus communis]|eukprot:XP_002525604.1 uncharacterized protein At4g26450 [Ricinus communis]
MHARHRSPGNGYRSNSMGMGFGASRISPDNSARGRGFYNSEYRSFNNRGFGRAMGQPKSFQPPPQPPPRKGDILMEAGRLAAEYLVSKGLLPQSALSASGKWQNGNSKKQVGDDYLQEELNQDGRTSAHSRLGSGASDSGIGKRRYSDDFNLRNHVKGRRRGEYYNRSYNSEWGGREYGRSGSWLDRNRVSPDMEGEGDTISGHYDEQQAGEDVSEGLQKSGLSGSVPDNEEAADMESFAEYTNSDEMGSKASSLHTGKDEAVGEPGQVSDDLTNLNSGSEEMKDNNFKHETEKQIAPEDLATQQCSVEGDILDKHESDLLTFCNFAKVPTKIRSALTYKVPKVDQVPNAEERNVSDGAQKGSEITVQDGTLDFATADQLPNTNDLKSADPEISISVQSAEDVGESGHAYGAGQVKCLRSQSFPDRAFMHDGEQQSSQGVLGFGRSISVKERGEKRVAEDGDMNEATKKPREWFASFNTANKHLHLSSPSQNQDSSQEKASPIQKVTVAVTQHSLVNSHQFPKTVGEPCNEYAQEKQLFPNSFKICDLNLMEASDLNDSHSNDPVLIHPSITVSKKEAAQVDIDLSISNCNLTDGYPRYANNGKNIEVIDLENDSTPEVKAFDLSQRKETAFTGPEGFPSRAQSVGDIADVHDNYDGLISEFLTTFSNTSVTEDISPLQSEMGLHNGEGTLGDDDSIYMSLGEIPLSFIPAWEQPTPQKYGKPF